MIFYYFFGVLKYPLKYPPPHFDVVTMYNNYDNTDSILYQLIINDTLYPLVAVEQIGEIPGGWQSIPRNFLMIIPGMYYTSSV